ncbi:MAG: helix-turn-helix transcriptional regulator [Solirubrobacteraceae bacterium]
MGKHERTKADTPKERRRAVAVTPPPRSDAPDATQREHHTPERARTSTHRNRETCNQGSGGHWGCGHETHCAERSAPDKTYVREVEPENGPSDLDIIKCINGPAELVRSTRERLGLSQRRLALRAGTTQAAISRIESGIVSPTFTTLRELMLAMGQEPALSAQRIPTDWDPAHMTSTLARTPEDRLELSLSWNRMAGRLAEAGRQAQEDG